MQPEFVGLHLFAGKVSLFARTKRLPLGEAGTASAVTDEGREALDNSFAVSAKRSCSPTLIRPFGAPSPRGRHGDFRKSKASPIRGSCRRKATDEVDSVA